MRLSFLSISLIAAGSSAFSQTLCDSVLSSSVYNLSERSSVESFASAYQTAMCDQEWTSLSSVETESSGFGMNLFDVVDFSESDASTSEGLKQAYSLFCSQTTKDIAYSSGFYEKYRSTDTAVNAWKECVVKGKGHFALVQQSLTLTGALVTLTIRGEGDVPALDVLSVEASEDEAIQCYFGSTLAQDAVFPEGLREVALTCVKRADIPLKLALNTNWGVYDQIDLDGFSEEIRDLQLEIAKLGSELLKTRSEMVTQTDLTNRRFVSFGQSLRIHNGLDSNFVITRHGGDGGRYISPYPLGSGGLGAFGSVTWTLEKE